MAPSGARGLIVSAYFVFREWLMSLSGAWSRGRLLGWLGFRVDKRNCCESISLCSFTGIILDSACRWVMLLIFRQPIDVLRAAFWATCNSFHCVWLVFGVQIGEQ